MTRLDSMYKSALMYMRLITLVSHNNVGMGIQLRPEIVRCIAIHVRDIMDRSNQSYSSSTTVRGSGCHHCEVAASMRSALGL